MKKIISAAIAILIVMMAFSGCGKQNVYSVTSSDNSSQGSSSGTASYKNDDSMLGSWLKFKNDDYYISFAGSIDANGEKNTQFIQGAKSGDDTAFIMYENDKISQHVFSLKGILYSSNDLKSYGKQDFDYTSKDPVFDSAMGGIFEIIGTLSETGKDDNGTFEKYTYGEGTTLTYWFDAGDCTMIEVQYKDDSYEQTSIYTSIELTKSKTNETLFALPDGAAVTES